MDYKYLGIDSTNNGKMPKIFVGVTSNNDKHIEEHTMRRLDPRDRKGQPCVWRVNYKHVFIPEEFSKRFANEDQINLIGICELIQYFKPKQVFIAESPLITSLSKLTEALKRLEIPEYEFFRDRIVITEQADTQYPIVNRADEIARQLRRYYDAKSSKKNKKHLDTLITPNIGDYRFLL